MQMILLVASMLAAPVPAKSADIALDQCLARDGGVTAVTACYQAALGRAETALSEQNRLLTARLHEGKVSPETLTAGEAAWQRYRDKWCGFEEAAERDAGGRSLTGLQCRVELTQAHLKRLKGAY